MARGGRSRGAIRQTPVDAGHHGTGGSTRTRCTRCSPRSWRRVYGCRLAAGRARGCRLLTASIPRGGGAGGAMSEGRVRARRMTRDGRRNLSVARNASSRRRGQAVAR